MTDLPVETILEKLNAQENWEQKNLRQNKLKASLKK